MIGSKRRKKPNGPKNTHLFEYSLLEPGISCDGEPVPDRVVPAILLAGGFSVPDMPKGDLMGAPVASLGDCEEMVGEVERAWLVGGNPRLRCSDLALDIIDYVSDPASREAAS
jgi:hypothetical protein